MKVPFAATLLTALLLCECQPSADSDKAVVADDVISDYVWPAFARGHNEGRIYYLGTSCPDDNYPRFPKPLFGYSRGKVRPQDVTAAYYWRGYDLQSESGSGPTRVFVGDPPRYALDQKINRLDLKPFQQANAFAAISAILSAKEVLGYQKSARINEPSYPVNMLGQTGPIEGLPYLPASMSNLTVDQALDAVARTFGVVVVYGSCKSPRMFDVYYVGIPLNNRLPLNGNNPPPPPPRP